MRLIVAAAIATFSCAPASAVITGTFTGRVASTPGYAGTLGPASANDPVVLSFRYDETINPSAIDIEGGTLYHFGQGQDLPVTANLSVNGRNVDFPTFNQGSYRAANSPDGTDLFGFDLTAANTVGDIRTIYRLGGYMSGSDFLNSFYVREPFAVLRGEARPFASEAEVLRFNVRLGTVVSREQIIFDWDRLDVAAEVPEPSTWAFMICGFGLLGGMARRQRLGQTPMVAAAANA